MYEFLLIAGGIVGGLIVGGGLAYLATILAIARAMRW